MILAWMAISKTIENYSRFIIVVSFFYMSILIPLFKRFIKRRLNKWGIWTKPVRIYDNDPFLEKELLKDPYLGYEISKNSPQVVFINSKRYSPEKLNKIIEKELKEQHEVNFIPLLNDYDLTLSHIYLLLNTRTNLIVFHNRLKSKRMLLLQTLFNAILALIITPLMLPFLLLFALLIKLDSPGPIFFTQRRIGKGSKPFKIYKFRTMYADAHERLQKLLEEDETIRAEWEKNYKLKNDPRITKIGVFLRKTSLDELPQVFNVWRGEMNFVGPRPVIEKELRKYYKENVEYYTMVKPGISGLWQVSGRSDTDYDFRVATDKWYVINWSPWLDMAILFKTIKVVLKREGAY
jgi:undecaprenyl-phosphate galactose phosphotransferase